MRGDHKHIRYSDHLTFRLSVREIDYDLPANIYHASKEKYYDTATDLLIAVGKTLHKGAYREFAVTYRETDDEILLITIHPLKQHQKENRIQTNRWKTI